MVLVHFYNSNISNLHMFDEDTQRQISVPFICYCLPGAATAFRVAALMNGSPGEFLEVKPVTGIKGMN